MRRAGRCSRWCTWALGAHLATASILSGQVPPDGVPTRGWPAPPPMAVVGGVDPQGIPPHVVGRMLVGGIVGGGAGLLVGGLAGAVAGSRHCSDPGNPDSCSGLEGMVIGGITGQAIGISAGVHLANGRRGELNPSLALNLALAAVGTAAVVRSDRRSVALGVALMVPVAQLVSSIVIERRTSRP